MTQWFLYFLVWCGEQGVMGNSFGTNKCLCAVCVLQEQPAFSQCSECEFSPQSRVCLSSNRAGQVPWRVSLLLDCAALVWHLPGAWHSQLSSLGIIMVVPELSSCSAVTEAQRWFLPRGTWLELLLCVRLSSEICAPTGQAGLKVS